MWNSVVNMHLKCGGWKFSKASGISDDVKLCIEAHVAHIDGSFYVITNIGTVHLISTSYIVFIKAIHSMTVFSDLVKCNILVS